MNRTTRRVSLFATFAACLLMSAAHSHAASISGFDPTFETPAESTNSYTYNPTLAFTSTSGIINPPSAFGAAAAPQGVQVGFLQTNTGDGHYNGSTNGLITGSIDGMTVGDTYTLYGLEAARSGQVGSRRVQRHGRRRRGRHRESSKLQFVQRICHIAVHRDVNKRDAAAHLHRSHGQHVVHRQAHRDPRALLADPLRTGRRRPDGRRSPPQGLVRSRYSEPATARAPLPGRFFHFGGPYAARVRNGPSGGRRVRSAPAGGGVVTGVEHVGGHDRARSSRPSAAAAPFSAIFPRDFRRSLTLLLAACYKREVRLGRCSDGRVRPSNR